MGRGASTTFDPLDISRYGVLDDPESDIIARRLALIDEALTYLYSGEDDSRRKIWRIIAENGSRLLTDKNPEVKEAFDELLRSYAKFNIRFTRFSRYEKGDYLPFTVEDYFANLAAKMRLSDIRSPLLVFKKDEKVLIHVREKEGDQVSLCGEAIDSSFARASVRGLKGKRVCVECNKKGNKIVAYLKDHMPSLGTEISEQYEEDFIIRAREALSELPATKEGGLVEETKYSIPMALTKNSFPIAAELLALHGANKLMGMSRQEMWDTLFDPVGNWQAGYSKEIDELSDMVKSIYGSPEKIEWPDKAYMAGALEKIMFKIKRTEMEGHHDDRFILGHFVAHVFPEAARDHMKAKREKKETSYFSALWRKYYANELGLKVKTKDLGSVSAFGPGGVMNIPLQNLLP
jgi:hypothetical protein